MNKPPLVSVIVTTHGRIDYLKECLQSILAQSYRDWECLVVTDFPSEYEEKRDLISQWSDERMSIFYSGAPGANCSRNKGLKLASGKYVFFLDDDDLWDPRKIALHVEAHMQGASEFVWSDSKKRYTFGDLDYLQWFDPLEGELFESRPNPLPFLCPSSSCVSLTAEIAKSFDWDESLPTFQDFDYFLRVSQTVGSFTRVMVPVTTFRIHLGHRVSGGLERRLSTLTRIMDKHSDLLADDFFKMQVQQEYIHHMMMEKVNKGRGSALLAMLKLDPNYYSRKLLLEAFRKLLSFDPSSWLEAKIFRLVYRLAGRRARLTRL